MLRKTAPYLIIVAFISMILACSSGEENNTSTSSGAYDSALLTDSIADLTPGVLID